MEDGSDVGGARRCTVYSHKRALHSSIIRQSSSRRFRDFALTHPPSHVFLRKIIPNPELSQPSLKLQRAHSPVAVDVKLAEHLNGGRHG